MSKKKMIIFNLTPINNCELSLEEFERRVKKAKELGATHVFISEVHKSRWVWEEDLSDPYPAWGMLNPSLFKIILPDELKEYYPNDYIKSNYELVKRKSEIVRNNGLKSAVYFCEPFYMPEKVFREHPEWRGPRCDHPRRSRRAYYSPCMDNPQILKFYKDATKEICKLADIDYMYLHTNDCGAGICWSEGLYAGSNGPEACKNIPQTERIKNYLNVFKEGAKEAGRNLYIETNAKIGVKALDPALENVWKSLDDNMAVNFKTNKGTPLSELVDLNYEFTLSPVKCIPLAVNFLEQLERAYHSAAPILKVQFLENDFDYQEKIYKAFFKYPTDGVNDRFRLLKNVFGKNLTEAFNEINEALKHLLSTFMEGFTWISVNQRVLTRPFVLFQNELTPDEYSYYRPYQIQAGTLEASFDLLNNQGSAFVKGYNAIWLASHLLDRTKGCLEKAINYYRLCGESDEILLAIDRIKLLICFINNYQNAMEFQQLVDETDFNETPIVTSKWPCEGDERLLRYEAIHRKEIDNTTLIIKLIKGREDTMLSLADKPENEDHFLLSPEIVSQLEKKIDIMQKHLLDGKRLFLSRNK